MKKLTLKAFKCRLVLLRRLKGDLKDACSNVCLSGTRTFLKCCIWTVWKEQNQSLLEILRTFKQLVLMRLSNVLFVCGPNVFKVKT